MRKLSAILLALAMVGSLAACGQNTGSGNGTAATSAADTSAAAGGESSGTTEAAGSGTEAPVTDAAFKNVMFVVTGNLGGGTNNDDVYAAISDYVATVDGNVDTFECNMDTSLYESTLKQAAETREYDLIVTCFGTMVEPMANTAAQFPDQKFMIFDTAMDFSDGNNSNVISVQVLQNEGGFLAGVLAALTTESEAPLANQDKVVGFVGAMESTAILDFLMGYIDGVNYVDSSVEVLYSFVGNHNDSALAKELGLTQYQQKADIVFGCGGNGLGVAEAAQEAGSYVIGVDFDYADRLSGTGAASADHVLTSVIKDYRGMVYPVLVEAGSGAAKWGTHTYISFGEGGVFLSEKNYKNIVPAAVLPEYEKIVADLAAGKIEVSTAFGASTEEIEAVKAQAASH